MASWMGQLDELLRGERTLPTALSEQGASILPVRRFLPLAIGLGVIYGFFMGWYALFGDNPKRYEQALASSVKLPALFLLTLLVTFPSLYVFSALLGCALRFWAMLRLMVAAITVNVAVAASLGPILGFFTVSTTSYPFMIVLNVALLAVAGFVALGFLLQTLRKLMLWAKVSQPDIIDEMEDEPAPAVPKPAAAVSKPAQPGTMRAPLKPTASTGDLMSSQALGQANLIFKVWIVIYALVGAQMGWLLRPFIGSPHLEFTWFRAREGNFFQSLMENLRVLMNLNID